MNNINHFINLIKLSFTKIEEFSDGEYDYFNIFTNISVYNRSFFEKLILNGNFKGEDIELHFPDMILLENGGVYYVGKDLYNVDVEYLTLKIKKYEG